MSNVVSIREAIKQIPGARRAMFHFRGIRSHLLPHEITFAEVARRNVWADKESLSGTGSNLEATAAVRRALPELWQRYGIRSLLDIPCGDFNWMRSIVHHLDRYMGMDVVGAVVQQVSARFGTDRLQFAQGNVLQTKLPAADMILVRDCLVHFSYRDAFRALKNLARSDARYVLLTTFPAHENRESITGFWWRPMNLQAPPFSLPEPLELVSEECTEIGGACADKSLGVWPVARLRALELKSR